MSKEFFVRIILFVMTSVIAAVHAALSLMIRLIFAMHLLSSNNEDENNKKKIKDGVESSSPPSFLHDDIRDVFYVVQQVKRNLQDFVVASHIINLGSPYQATADMYSCLHHVIIHHHPHHLVQDHHHQMNDETTHSREALFAYFSWFTKQTLDFFLGCLCAYVAWNYADAVHLNVGPVLYYIVVTVPDGYVDWFLGWPAGFKGNEQLNTVLGNTSLSLIRAYGSIVKQMAPHHWIELIRLRSQCAQCKQLFFFSLLLVL
jgi:hypothetical protein